MSVLITGASGFIGSHTANFFVAMDQNIVGCDSLTYAANLDVFNDLKFKIPLYKVDICETERIVDIIKNHKIKTIINFAAETHVDNSISDIGPFLHSNISGVASILRATRETGSKLIHISTDEVYGPAIGSIKFNEDSNLSPKNPYASTKASADLIIQSFKNTYGVDARIIRPCNNFGPRQHREKFIPTVLRSIAEGKRIPIYGNGQQIREWMFVKDTARIIYEIYDKELKFDVLNVTSSFELKNIEVVRKITEILRVNFDESVQFVKDRLGHDERYSISSEKLRSLLDYNFTDFDKALLETI